MIIYNMYMYHVYLMHRGQNRGVTSASRGHCPGVPTSFGYFATVYGLIEALDFHLMVVDWER